MLGPAAEADTAAWRRLRFACGVAVVAAVGFALRLWQLDGQGIWYDEAVTASYATAPWQAIPGLAAADVHPPLSFLLLKPWTLLAGTSDYALRWPSVAFGVLAMPLLFQLTRRVISDLAFRSSLRPWRPPESAMRERVAILAALLLCLSPVHVYYSQEARMYTLVVFLAALAAWALVRALGALPGQDRPWGYWAVFGLSGLAGVYTHYFFAIYLVGLGTFAVSWLVAIALSRRFTRGRVRQGLLGLTAATALVAAGFAPWVPIAVSRFQDDVSFFATDLGPLQIALRLLGVLSFGWFQTLAVQQWALLAGGVLFLLGVAYLLRPFNPTRGPFSGVFLLVAIVVPVLLYLGITADRPKIAERYLLALLPLFLLVVASGLGLLFSPWALRLPFAALRQTSIVLASALLAFLLFVAQLGIAEAYYGEAPRRPDFRGAARTIAAQGRPGDAVIAVGGHGQVALRHYLPGWDIYGIPDITVFDLRAQVGEEAVDRLNAIREKHGRAWVVLWQRDLGDPGNVVVQQLDLDRERLTVPGRYAGVDVLLYDLAGPPFVRESELATPVNVRFGELVELVGYRLERTSLAPGEALRVTLIWRPTARVRTDLIGFLQILNPADRIYGQTDQRAGGDFYQSTRWTVGANVVDRYTIPIRPGAPPGGYRLIAGLYEPDGQRLEASAGGSTVQLADVTLAPASTADGFTPPRRMDGVFGELRAIGWDIDRHSYAPGDTVEASVWWTARGRPSADYDLVYRVIGPNGENLATAESRGAGDVFPASQWPAGSLMRDVVRLRLPGDLRAGDYRLQAGVRLDGATVVGAAPWSIAGFLTVR